SRRGQEGEEVEEGEEGRGEEGRGSRREEVAPVRGGGTHHPKAEKAPGRKLAGAFPFSGRSFPFPWPVGSGTGSGTGAGTERSGTGRSGTVRRVDGGWRSRRRGAF